MKGSRLCFGMLLFAVSAFLIGQGAPNACIAPEIKAGSVLTVSHDLVQVTFNTPYPDGAYAIVFGVMGYEPPPDPTYPMDCVYRDKTPQGFKVGALNLGGYYDDNIRCDWMTVRFDNP